MSRLTARTERVFIHATYGGDRHVYVSYEAPKLQGERPRLPMNLSFVIDRSGSMSGEKIQTAIAGTQEGIRRLGAADRFSVVAYDDQVTVPVPSTPGTAEGKARAIAAVAGLEPGGSTDLHGGWMNGCNQIASFLAEGQVARCLLFTDGQVNHGVRDEETLVQRARELRARGIVTTTFGIGLDFNEHLLTRIADAGGGRGRYVEHAGGLPAMLGAELNDTLDVVHRAAELHIRCPAGVRLEPIGPWEARREGDLCVLSLGDLVSEEITELVLRVRVPPGSDQAPFRITFQLHDRTGALPDADGACTWIRTPEAANKAQVRDVLVDRIVAARHAARAREQAVAANRARDHRKAADLLLGVAAKIDAYAGGDAELVKLVADLRRDAGTYGQTMTVMQQKQAHYQANAESRGRNEMGSAKRKS